MLVHPLLFNLYKCSSWKHSRLVWYKVRKIYYDSKKSCVPRHTSYHLMSIGKYCLSHWAPFALLASPGGRVGVRLSHRHEEKTYLAVHTNPSATSVLVYPTSIKWDSPVLLGNHCAVPFHTNSPKVISQVLIPNN